MKPQHNDDDLLDVEPDDDEANPLNLRIRPRPNQPSTQALNAETVLDRQAIAITPPQEQPAREGASPAGEALRWALDSLNHPSLAAADWLARDIDATAHSAADLLSNPKITLTQVRQAKAAFKTMRIVGEKSADRRVGARMYTAAIAAGLVRHGKRISTQSDAALKRGFQALLDDRSMPQPLRDLAGMALCLLQDNARSKSA